MKKTSYGRKLRKSKTTPLRNSRRNNRPSSSSSNSRMNVRHVSRQKKNNKNRKKKFFLNRRMYRPIVSAGENGPLVVILKFFSLMDLIYNVRLVSRIFFRVVNHSLLNQRYFKLNEKRRSYFFGGRKKNKKGKLHYCSEKLFIRFVEGRLIDTNTSFNAKLRGDTMVKKNETMDIHEYCIRRNLHESFAILVKKYGLIYDRTLLLYTKYKRMKFLRFLCCEYDEFMLTEGLFQYLISKNMWKIIYSLLGKESSQFKEGIYAPFFKPVVLCSKHSLEKFKIIFNLVPFDPIKKFHLISSALASFYFELLEIVLTIESDKKLSIEDSNKIIHVCNREGYHSYRQFLGFCFDCVRNENKDSILVLDKKYFDLHYECLNINIDRSEDFEDLKLSIDLYEYERCIHYEIPFFHFHLMKEKIVNVFARKFKTLHFDSFMDALKGNPEIASIIEGKCLNRMNANQKYELICHLVRLGFHQNAAELFAIYPEPIMETHRYLELYKETLQSPSGNSERLPLRGKLRKNPRADLLEMLLEFLEWKLPYQLFYSTVFRFNYQYLGIKVFKHCERAPYEDFRMSNIVLELYEKSKFKMAKYCLHPNKYLKWWKSSYLNLFLFSNDEGARLNFFKKIGLEKHFVKCEYPNCGKRINVLRTKCCYLKRRDIDISQIIICCAAHKFQD